MTAQIKKVSTTEANISRRTVTYDLYINGEYISTYSDVCEACEIRDELNLMN
tara:strand:+ start:166 stop:321 length:156 start_codon:yes stop_codon:yes gene_type:complete